MRKTILSLSIAAAYGGHGWPSQECWPRPSAPIKVLFSGACGGDEVFDINAFFGGQHG